MSMPFAFVPRQVSRSTKVQGAGSSKTPSAVPQQRAESPSQASDSEDGSEAPEAVATGKDKKGKRRAVDVHGHDAGEDIAALTLLSLSDYRIWSDADLRSKLDECLKTGGTSAAGFVPINYLMRRPPFRGFLSVEPSEVEVVKALRAYANEVLEVRMLVSAPSSSVWYGTGKTSRKKDVGGYEVRRKDWERLLDHPLHNLSSEQWDDRTLYMECVPTQYRSLAGIARFTQALLPALPSSLPSPICVQNVTLPPHYLDKPGDIPKCRGYALVTFSTTEQRDVLLRDWPWKRRPYDPTEHETLEVKKEAQRFGFRTISKMRWDQLNEEYVAYRQQLVDEIFEANKHAPSTYRADIPSETDVPTRVRPEDEDVPIRAPASPPPGGAPKTTIASPYPYGCLVFVKNIHPETNKTTLKALFAKAFAGKPTGVDYVDFNKGMDSCYLRLASPHHTDILTEHFTRHPTVQVNGLDDTGRAPNENEQTIKMELIEGKREALYWKNIPEKVRRQAVEKVLQAEQPINVCGPNIPTPSSTATTRGGKKRKR
ncbi:hypothetical protein BKA83DRAFT_4191928 [Pisolithus microcarpus]|nr:hypothetical protein BKA83DRAFT_4191928 [Pisolithus microcarpus]